MIEKVLKRDNKTLVEYDRSKISMAISKANAEVDAAKRISYPTIDFIIRRLEKTNKTEISVEEIQDFIEDRLMALGYRDLAKVYITYRYKRALVRKANTTDDSILRLLKNENEEVQRENSNKKSVLNSTKRDLIAGEVSKDITMRFLLPEDIVDAHRKGILHFHDADYFAQPEFNCCLPNFRDMLENGTCINGIKIDSPKSFRVACNQVTQFMAQFASNQYGGQTFYSDVLGKYLAETKKKFENRIRKTVEGSLKGKVSDDLVEETIKSLLDEEIKIELQAGIQCIQYQINTMLSTNGQSPFVTIFMYLRDDDPYLEENALIIEEILRQRLVGLKNKAGVYVTPTFPKLVYVLSENNCLKGGKYDYLTHLAAECTAKRIYPDYISEKVMKEHYDGEVFGCINDKSCAA